MARERLRKEAREFMATYIAHYQSPKGSYERERGLFEFESDARMKMLELFGASAVSWTIEKVERAGAAPAEKREKTTDGQLALDFRPPKPERKRKHSKGYW